MSIAPAYRVHSGNDDKILALAIKVVDRSGVPDMLSPTAPFKSGAGRPTNLAPYNLRSVLICMFEIAWSGSVLSWANIVRRLWFDYSDQSMSDIGLPNFRTDERVLAMAPAVDLPFLTGAQMLKADAALGAEYKRLWKFLDVALTAVHTNTAPAGKRHTRGVLDGARKADDLAVQSAMLKRVMNKIVAASIEVHNDIYFPETEGPLEGILKGWTGDVAVDEHIITADLGEGTGTAPHQMNSANQQARGYAHIRRTKFGSGIGSTFAIATSRPGRREVPAIATGMALNDPSPGSIPGLFDALTGASDLRPRLSSNRTQHVVVDMGYTGKPTLAENLLERGYGLVMKYPAPWGNLFDLNKDSTKKNGKEFANTGKTSGPYLFNGSCVCPGASRATLNGPRFDVPAMKKRTDSVEDSQTNFETDEAASANVRVNTKTGEIDQDETPETHLQRLVDHHMAEATITCAIMPTHGRPVAATARKRGRPRLGEPEPAKVFRLSVQCPARAGLAQCPLFVPDGETEQETKERLNLPAIPEPPVSLEDAPAVCQTPFSTIEMNVEQFNRWQPMMAGTWTHEDLYMTARSRNEWFHSQLVSRNGGNLNYGAIQFRKNATFSIAAAISVAVTNMKILQSWQEDLTKKSTAPMHGGAHRKTDRAFAINAELTKYMKPNSK